MSSVVRPLRSQLFGLLGCLLPAFGLAAASETIYVNNRLGSDQFDGRAAAPANGGKTGPVATIAQALKLVPISGRVSIADTGVDYREAVRVQALRKGRAAAPLVIEGNGAALSGLVAVPAARWVRLKEDVYFFENQLPGDPPTYGPMPNSNWLGHLRHQGWFTERQAPEIFFLDGQPAPHVRDLAALPPGGFFYDTQSSPRRLYFRLPAGKKLADCAIELPLNAGLFVDDDYVVVRNLASKYSQDDGFAGFWGIGVIFENCNGSFNCDQGMSLHGTSVTVIDGGLYERNGGCGIADVMSSFTVYRNAVIRDNMIAGALFAGLGHSLLSCRLYGNYGLQVNAGTGCALNMTNCLVIGTSADGAADGVSMEIGRLDHCTIVNCGTGVWVAKSGSIANSVVANCAGSLVTVDKAAVGSFRMWKTVLAAGTVVYGTQRATPANWDEFANSVTWAKVNNILTDLKLEAPLYALPQDSPYLKAADYDTTPGATLGPYAGWKPREDAAFAHPHP